ncbi:MAG: CHAT domain-containing protein [Candidatus Microbacterium colombiense]|nr:MAG: CHAT domain-containing protein [Microbacterium sp.]
MILSSEELHRRGVEAANARRFDRARRALDLAAARTEDPDLRARIDGTIAYVLDQTGEHSSAEALSRELLRREGLSANTIALLSGQLGILLMHAGNLDSADKLLTRAIDTIPRGTIEFANLLMSRSMVLMQQHHLDRCAADLLDAIEVFEATNAMESLARARHNLGYTALLRGDLVAALQLMSESRPVFAETSELATAISDLDRAEVLRDAGLTTEAEVLLGEVVKRFGAQRMRQARGEAEYHLARSLLRHDLVAAERTATAAMRRFTALRSDGWAARSEALRLEARTRALPDSPPPAADFSVATAALVRNGSHAEATALRMVARLAGHGRMPKITQDDPTPLQLRAHEVRALRAVGRGRNTEAMRAAADGLDLLAGWQQSFGALDLQASVAMQGSELVFAGLTAAARTRDPETLFAWSERARHLSQQVAPLRPPHDDALATDLAELRMLRADLAGHDWTTDARVRVLRDRVRERQWSSTRSGGTNERVDLAETTALLDADTAVLAYVFTGTALHCVMVTASAARIVDLSLSRVRAALDGLRADLDVAALTRGGLMAEVIARSLDARLAVLDTELVAPVRGSARRLVVTSPGILAGVPWAMLPGMHGTPFTLATSVSRWSADRRRPLEESSRIGFAAGPRVPRAGEEIRQAAAAWGASPVQLHGPEATVTAVTALAGTTDLLHIAAHGRHAVDNPLFSGFELADGTLFGYDVDLIPTAPATVILSACELGRSSVRWGEEALGMTRVWLHAGTRCVIAAPVVVPDDVASELLSAVHTELARGADAATALAQASAETGHRAPFQCHGSGF